MSRVYYLRHNPSALLVKAEALYGSCVDPLEADKWPTPEEAIAACPLPVKDYTVVGYRPAR